MYIQYDLQLLKSQIPEASKIAPNFRDYKIMLTHMHTQLGNIKGQHRLQATKGTIINLIQIIGRCFLHFEGLKRI